MRHVQRDAVPKGHTSQTNGVIDMVDNRIERFYQLAGISGVEEIVMVSVGVAEVVLCICSNPIGGPCQVIQVVDKRIVRSVSENRIKLISCVYNRLSLCICVAPMTPISSGTS